MSTRDRLARHLPVFGLEIRTPMLTLRYPDDDDVLDLAELAARGIHDDDWLPFSVPWTRAPVGELEPASLRYHWGLRSSWTADAWELAFAVVVGGEVVGTQGLIGHDFAVRRTVSTGSWLGRAHQGRGIGTEMRAAVLHLAFAGLGADRAETAAWADNGPSLAVTRKLGYSPNGDELLVSEGAVRRQLRFTMARSVWEARRRDDIEVVGVDACLAMFGA